MVSEADAAFLLERHEVDHHIGLVVADGDGDIALMDDTQGNGGIGRPRPYLLDVWDTEDDEHPTVVVLITGTLVGIADVRHKIVGDVELLFQLVLVVFCRTRHLYPTIGLPLRELGQSALGVPESLHCANPVLIHNSQCIMHNLAAKGLAALLAIPRHYKS